MATTTLGNKSVGSIVKLKENGVLVDFYVAKHDYENGLNGSGRTLVVRKDCYDTRQWHTSNVNAYATSAIDTWLNNTYKNLLDADIRGVIGTTKIKYTPGNGNTTVGTLERAIFLLSVTELGKTGTLENTDQSLNKLSHVFPPVLKGCGGVVDASLAPAILAAADCLQHILAVAHRVDGCHDGCHNVAGDASLDLRGSSLCRSGRSGLFHRSSRFCSRSSLGSCLLAVHGVKDLALQRDDGHQQDEDQKHQHNTGYGNDHIIT